MTRKNHTTVLVIIDGGRDDYVRPDTMPFLDGIARGGIHGSFDDPPGFAQNTVLFTGCYPDTSGSFGAFAYDPEASPFRWVKMLGPFGHAITPSRPMFPARRAIDGLTKKISGAAHPDPAWIPPRYLPYFTPVENLAPADAPDAFSTKSIFDLCRTHGLGFRYLASPGCADDNEVQDTLVRALREGEENDLYVARFNVADSEGHRHGPFSRHVQGQVLNNLDDRLASIHAALAAAYDSWDLLVCGNHGMAPIRQKVDVLDVLGRSDARPVKDYVVFVNSTMAMFWYHTDHGRKAVERLLPTIPGSRVVSDEERRRLRIPTGPRWGDRILAAEPGVLFWPDYFHVTSTVVKGMHGYLDKRDAGHGMGVLVSDRIRAGATDVGIRPLVDVFPTLCDLLGVPVPDGQDGDSLLAETEIMVER